MTNRSTPPRKLQDLFLILVCLVFLFPCLYFPYAASSPELGFALSDSNWKVVTISPCKFRPDQCLKPGDQILRIEDYDRQRFLRTRSVSIADLFGSDQE